MSRNRAFECMNAHLRSTGEDNRRAANQPWHRPSMRVGHQSKVKQAVTSMFALALGFAMGFVFRGTENLGFLEWVIVLLAIAAMAAGYYIRGIELDGDETRPLSRPHDRSNVICLASQRSPVPGSRARGTSAHASVVLSEANAGRRNRDEDAIA